MKITTFETATYIACACGVIGLALLVLHSKRPESVSLCVATGFLSIYLLWTGYAVLDGVVELVRWVWTLTPWSGS